MSSCICLARSIVRGIQAPLGLKMKGGPKYGATWHAELPSGKVSLHLHMPEAQCWEALAVERGISVVVQILTLCFPI